MNLEVQKALGSIQRPMTLADELDLKTPADFTGGRRRQKASLRSTQKGNIVAVDQPRDAP